MKRKYTLIIAIFLVLSLSLVGCGKGESSVASNDNLTVSSAPTPTQEQKKPADDLNSAIEVLAEYTLGDSIGWYTRHFMVVKNNSNKDVNVSTSSLGYDNGGNLLGAADAKLEVLGSGCTSIIIEHFETDATIDHYETTVSATECRYYKSVIQDLSFTESLLDNGVVYHVTNNGEATAEFVEGFALFFRGNELFAFDSTFFIDDDSEIKPGAMISKQFTTSENFDKVEFYLTGRSSQSGSSSTSSSDADNIKNSIEVVAEYTLADSIGWYTRHFMVIKNNSNKTVDVSTSSLAYDVAGNIIGAEDSSFEALGAGCTSLIFEAFEVEGTIDHYETTITASESKYHESVIQDISFSESLLNNGAIYQVTNNGTNAAQFVEGYALFFRGDEVVHFDSTYFVDNDSELKPGNTISKQFTIHDSFDSVQFYLSGRR